MHQPLEHIISFKFEQLPCFIAVQQFLSAPAGVCDNGPGMMFNDAYLLVKENAVHQLQFSESSLFNFLYKKFLVAHQDDYRRSNWMNWFVSSDSAVAEFRKIYDKVHAVMAGLHEQSTLEKIDAFEMSLIELALIEQIKNLYTHKLQDNLFLELEYNLQYYPSYLIYEDRVEVYPPKLVPNESHQSSFLP